MVYTGYYCKITLLCKINGSTTADIVYRPMLPIIPDLMSNNKRSNK